MKDPLQHNEKPSAKERPKPLHEMEEVPAPLRKILGGLDRLARGPQRHRLSRGERHYAGFHDRLMANVLDFFLIFIFLSPVFAEINSWIYEGASVSEVLSTSAQLSEQDQQAAVEYVRQSGWVEGFLQTYIAQIVILGFIYVYFWSHFSATPGKLILGLKIVNRDDETPIDMSTAIHRYLGFLISLPPLMLGFVWMNFNKKHQTWHDMVGGTIVIYTEKGFWGNLKQAFSWIKAKLFSKRDTHL